jgi:hypothetical protein
MVDFPISWWIFHTSWWIFHISWWIFHISWWIPIETFRDLQIGSDLGGNPWQSSDVFVVAEVFAEK